MIIVGLIISLLIITLIVSLHEFGHLFAAKLSKVRVYEFGVGIPPRVFKIWRGSKKVDLSMLDLDYLPEVGTEVTLEVQNLEDGTIRALEIHNGRLAQPKSTSFSETNDVLLGKIRSIDGKVATVADMLWSFNAIPLGGYVAMVGEKGLKIKTSLSTKSTRAKLAIMFAGIGLNLMLPFLLFPISSLFETQMLVEGDVVVQAVEENSVADVVGIMEGDEITSYGGRSIVTGTDLSEAISSSQGEAVVLEVLRSGEQLSFNPTVEDRFGVSVVVENPVFSANNRPFFESLGDGFLDAASIYPAAYSAVSGFFSNPSGQVFTGPVGIADITGQVVTNSGTASTVVANLLRLAALISFGVGIFNLIPMPPLDGGKIAFALIEGVTRRPISRGVESTITIFGMVLLIALTVVIFTSDIARLA